MELNDIILIPWGKYHPTGDQIFHPLFFHLIDTANVAELVYDRVLSSQAKALFTRALGVDDSDTAKWVGVFAGCHDIGKATPGFQNKVEGHAHVLEQAGLPVYGARSDHALMTIVVMKRLLNNLLPNDRGMFSKPEIISRTLGAHHGKFVHPAETSRVIDNDIGGEAWMEVQAALLKKLISEMDVGIEPSPSVLSKEEQSAFVMLFLGLTVFSDWLASNIDFFPVFEIIPTVEEYRAISKRNAERTLDSLHYYSKSNKINVPAFSDLFPELKETNELQNVCIDLMSRQTEPGLMVIEAPMGEGKTEAALYSMTAWNVNSGHKGCFFALPTQATSNQMFTRLNKFLAGDSDMVKKQLVLLHGRALLSDEYANLLSHGECNGRFGGNVVAEEWFSYRKRGLLSPFGVGTIDQVLLSAIHTKHYFLRMFGLAGKTIIIDEVHSYDLYTGTILDHVLRWLSALNANVILMSATLPGDRLERLIGSYSPGCILDQVDYPNVRMICNGQAKSVTFRSMSQIDHRRAQAISLKIISNFEHELVNYFKGRKCTEGSFAIILNTVEEAQKIFEILRPLRECGYEVSLLHARFPYKRRDAIEREAISKFSKKSNGRERDGILVSTQIIEQSLDLDFDAMFTKLAPVDLVLQRSGRLHRHIRDGRPSDLSSPSLTILAPPIIDGVPDFGSDQFVYDEYVLLRSWLFFKGNDTIRLPTDLQRAVETVYSEMDPADQGANVAQRLVDAKQKMEQWENEVQEKAAHRLVAPPDSELVWSRHDEVLNDDLDDEVQGLTRLGAPSVEVVLLYEINGKTYLDQQGSYPLCDNTADRRFLLRNLLDNSFRISLRKIVIALKELEKKEKPWPPMELLRYHIPLVMTEWERVWHCQVGGIEMMYDDEFGFRYETVS